MTRKIDIGSLPPEQAELREFISDFAAASARMRELRRALAETLGLTVAQHAVLLGLWYCERRGSTTVRALADHLHIAAAHATAELNKLERAGLVEKRPSAADKRAIELRLKRKGHALLDQLAPLLQNVNAALFSGVNLDDMRGAHRLFRAVIEHGPAAIAAAEAATPRKAKSKSKTRRSGS
jgi:MarR family transcriptional regulator, organic hydroperoxide resistance regulator